MKTNFAESYKDINALAQAINDTTMSNTDKANKVFAIITPDRYGDFEIMNHCWGNGVDLHKALYLLDLFVNLPDDENAGRCFEEAISIISGYIAKAPDMEEWVWSEDLSEYFPEMVEDATDYFRDHLDDMLAEARSNMPQNGHITAIFEVNNTGWVVDADATDTDPESLSNELFEDNAYDFASAIAGAMYGDNEAATGYLGFSLLTYDKKGNVVHHTFLNFDMTEWLFDRCMNHFGEQYCHSLYHRDEEDVTTIEMPF